MKRSSLLALAASLAMAGGAFGRGNFFGDFSGRLFQTDRRETHFTDGASASSFRIERLGGAESNRPILDHFHFAGFSGH